VNAEGGGRDELPEVDVGAHNLCTPQCDLEVVENPTGRPNLRQKLQCEGAAVWAVVTSNWSAGLIVQLGGNSMVDVVASR
jgi:hypothetical protein